MDFDQLKNQVSNLTLYDLKAGFRKAQNAVMNYTEMEAKVREATNNEPWGCPTSVMQEVANGTFNYATLNEIMPMIYKRFTEKAAEEWRQIYKALQLLEFLIKNGSERVVDDARSHLSLLKMLRQFHYIDENGKDQGINVRNRAKELAELLGDVERIRAERKKARATRNKYGGVEGGAGIGGSGSSRYGGFGNESGSASYGGYSGGVYGDGGGFGGASTDDYSASQSRRDRFEEYDEYDENTVASPSSRRRQDLPSATKRTPVKPKEPEVDLFDFSADDITAPSAGSNGSAAAMTPGFDDFGAMQGGGAGDDDFDDFQSAASVQPPSTTNQFIAPQPLSPPPASTMSSIPPTISPPPTSTTPSSNYAAFKAPPANPSSGQQQQNFASLQPQQGQVPRPAGYQAAAPNYFGSISTANIPSATTPGTSGLSSPSISTKPAGKKPSSAADPFAGLAVGSAKKQPAQPTKGPTMAAMAREKASAGIWGTSTSTSTSATTFSTPQAQQQQPPSGGESGNDLLGL